MIRSVCFRRHSPTQKTAIAITAALSWISGYHPPFLKRCGLSLNAIRQQLQTRTLKSSDALFARQQADIEAQIRQLQLLHARICAKRKTLAPLLKGSDAPPIRQIVTQGHVLLCEPVDPPYQLSDISIATKRCFSRAFHQQLPIHFQIGVSVPLAHLRNDRCMEATLAFLPMDASAAAHADLVLPEGTCVIGTHHGRYDQIHHTYAQIFAFCKQQHLTIVSDSYEFCLHDHLTEPTNRNTSPRSSSMSTQQMQPMVAELTRKRDLRFWSAFVKMLNRRNSTMTFAEKIYQLRRQNGWSQEDLAQRLHVSRQSISKWENALSMPEGTKLSEIARLFQISLDELLSEDPIASPFASAYCSLQWDIAHLQEAEDFLKAVRKIAHSCGISFLFCMLSPFLLLYHPSPNINLFPTAASANRWPPGWVLFPLH